MDFSDLNVVVWTESEEREAWWRDIVGVGVTTAGAPATEVVRNREPSAVVRCFEQASAGVVHAA